MKQQLKEQVNHRTAYIGEMAAELAGMARTENRPMLAYLLEIAMLEADLASGKSKDGGKSEDERLR
jgi:hypothetical protein